MKKRQLGHDGPEVGAIALGCMRMSNFQGTTISRRSPGDAESVATIEAALDAGINFLDTGDFYGMGHNELLISRAIKERRDDAFLSVKFGAQKSPSGAFLGADLRPNSVKNFAAYSLQRLDVDVIDLYQPGRLDPTIPVEDTVGAIADLIREGKVRYLGLSEVTADQLRKAHSVHPVSALQIEYSLATRFIEREILPTARELGVSIVPYNVLSHGLLAGGIKGPLSPGDPRLMISRFEPANLAKNLQTIAAFEAMAADKGCNPSQLAIAWVLSRGEDIVPLVGMSRRSRLPENLAALNVNLTPDDLKKLDELFAPGAITGERVPAHVRHLSPK